jgi:fatty-acyl-CoA synthase
MINESHLGLTFASSIAGMGRRFPDSRMTFQDRRGQETLLLFDDIEARTAIRSGALAASRLSKGDRIGLLVSDPREFLVSFLAAVRLGIIPVALYPIPGMMQRASYLERNSKIIASAEPGAILVDEEGRSIASDLCKSMRQPAELRLVADIDAKAEPCMEYPPIYEEDPAFLQYTSGSTGDPRGVIITHRCLMANVRGICKALDLRPSDTTVSWLPMYHDMGLVGFLVTPIVAGMSNVLIPTERFLRNPTVWIDALHRHRGTVTFTPPFGLSLAMRRIKRSTTSFDLSSLRVLGCGAEPIPPDLLLEFPSEFRRFKLRSDALLPAYGMAEATLAISFKPLDEAPSIRRVDAEVFQSKRLALEVREPGKLAEHVSTGVPLDEVVVEIRGPEGRRLSDGHEGEIWVCGPSVSPSYFNDPISSRETFQDGWLRTGDLGYRWQGQIYVTGRQKNIIILNGNNVQPQTLEWAAARSTNIRRDRVVAFSRPGKYREEVILVVEVTDTGQDEIKTAMKRVVYDRTGIPVTEVVCVRPGTIPRTSSGKLQRGKVREDYLRGQLGKV